MSSDTATSAETRVGRRKRKTRGRILQAALDLFVKKGLDEATVAEIAEAADVGKGTFFSYFPTKESVFAEVSALMMDAMDRRLDQAIAAGAPAEGRILTFFQPAIEWHTAHPVLSRFMVAAFMRDPVYAQADRPIQRRLYERLTRELTEARARGHLTKDVDVDAAATDVVGVYFGSLGAWHISGQSTPLGSDFARSLQIVFRGLRP